MRAERAAATPIKMPVIAAIMFVVRPGMSTGPATAMTSSARCLGGRAAPAADGGPALPGTGFFQK
jgi:hypothetical protein